MGELQEKLQSVGYRLGLSLERQVRSALETRPCSGGFLTGPAGAGKTFLAESVAQIQDRKTFFFQAFPGCRKEELFQTILPDASQPSGFRTLAGVLPQAAQASHEQPTALILDEWDKTHPSTDAFLLDFLQTGRVSIPGSEIRAKQENLVVFVTLNNERELSEMLLRRLPLIELKPASPRLVAVALNDTHAGHAFLAAGVTLYRRSQLVNLSKPVTIQELRQLLDAITLLGPEADWNELVFQYITKNWDDHQLLKSAEALPLTQGDTEENDKPVLAAAQYEAQDLEISQTELFQPRMPIIQRDWMERVPAAEFEVGQRAVFGVVTQSEQGYDGVARALLNRHGTNASVDDPADLKIARVGDNEIIVFEALDFERLQEWGQVLRDGGELLLEARHEGEITPDMLQEFKDHPLADRPDDSDRCRIYSYTDNEMLLRYRSIKIRWTPELLEVVAYEYEPTRELWEFLYGKTGAVLAAREATIRIESSGEVSEDENGKGLPSNEKLGEDYLFVLRDFQHLRKWFSLLLNRNLKVWGRVTCDFANKSVRRSALSVEDFSPENESPESKEEADAIHVFNSYTQPAMDYYEAHLNHIETELTQFVAENGELPPAVEDGGIFSLYEVHTDMAKIKRNGLKLYMRKNVREA